MHSPEFRKITVARPALLLSALAAGLCLSAGTALGSGSGLKARSASSQIFASGYTLRLFEPGDTMDETGLRPPSAARRFFGQGLLLPQTLYGALDGLEAVDRGAFYYSGSRSGMHGGLLTSETFYGLHARLSPTWSSQLQTSITRAAGRGPPLYSLSGQLQAVLSSGWELSLGLRYDMRDTAAGAFGASASASASSPYTPDTVPGAAILPPWLAAANTGMHYRLQLNYLYGVRNSLGLGFSSGRHPDELAIRGLPLDDSRQFSLTGNHWLNQDWALNYGIATGEMNRRQGLHLGLRYLF